MLKRILIAVLMLGLVLTACSKKDKGAATEGLRGQAACLTTPSPIAEPTFPTPFPQISDVTWTANSQAGPSQIIQGYTGDALEDLFNEMKDKYGTNPR